MCRFGSLVLLVDPLLWLARHVLNVENLSNILSSDEWLISVPKIVKINYWHTVLIFCDSSQLHPLAPKQRHLEIGTIIKFPYLFNVTVKCLLFFIAVCGIQTDTTILICAFLSWVVM